MTTRIQTQAGLLALTSRKARRGVLRVELNVPGYSRDVRRLQHQLNRCLRTRGWAMATLFVLFGAALYAAVLPLLPAPPAAGAASRVVAGAAALVALGLSGKFAGLWWADRCLRRALREYRV